MLKQHFQSGFTLVEMAIVLIITGLMVGGLLQGQAMTDHARVVAEVSQIKAISSASKNFENLFATPAGDLMNAGTRIPGCPGVGGVACNPLVCAPEPCAGAADGIIGNPAWAAQGALPWLAPNYGTSPNLPTANKVDDERYLYWAHLMLTNMYAGTNVSALGTAGIAYTFGITHPAVKLGGGLQVGYDNGFILPGSDMPAGSGLSGLLLIQETQAELTGPLSIAAGGNALTPFQAWEVDVKMDDGRPGTGYVQAFGLQTSCFSTAAPYTVAAPGYNQVITTTDCGLMFRIAS